MAKYHVCEDGTVGECTAEERKCPLGGEHFDDPNLAQNHADRINETSVQTGNVNGVKWGTTTVKLEEKHSIDSILESKNFMNRLANRNREIAKLVDHAEDLYVKHKKILKKKGIRKIPRWEDFYNDFTKNDPFYKIEMEKRIRIYNEMNEILEHRTEAAKIFHDTKSHIIEKSFSRASSSSYFVYNSNSLNSIKEYLDKNGYEYKIRPDINKALGENFLVRYSDHDPGTYLNSKDDEESIWKYTDASILVTYKPHIPEKMNDKKLRKKIKDFTMKVVNSIK